MTRFQLLGLLVLFLYYGSYFLKMRTQRRHGIKTDRMGLGSKPKRTRVIETFLRAVTFSMAAVQVISVWLDDRWLLLIHNRPARFIGIGVSFAGLIVFILAMITMRDSWRAGIAASQRTTFVTAGLYRLSRNPAFLGFDLFYVGLTVAFCNIVQLFFMVAAVGMLHLQILEEERFLPTVFGEEYVRYKREIGRYLTFPIGKKP